MSQCSTLIVTAPDTSYFVLLFQKQGNAANRRCFEVCKTSKLHSTRSVLPRQGHAFHAMESSRKGDGFILFASAKRTKKQPGLRPATSVQIAGRNSVFTEMTGVHQVTGCANHYFAQYRRQWFEPLRTPSLAQTDMQLCMNSKRILLLTVGYDGLQMGGYGFVKMGCFFR